MNERDDADMHQRIEADKAAQDREIARAQRLAQEMLANGPFGVESVYIGSPETVVKGGKVNYYLVEVKHPQREYQPPYVAECEDIGVALELTPDEMNIFKEIWRSANARKGNGKPDHKVLYGAQKIYHYAGRILKARMIEAGTWVTGYLKTL